MKKASEDLFETICKSSGSYNFFSFINSRMFMVEPKVGR